jgi:ABC-type bacteriocin/lantibiotic exporter with double-glycine peptidase domain
MVTSFFGMKSQRRKLRALLKTTKNGTYQANIANAIKIYSREVSEIPLNISITSFSNSDIWSRSAIEEFLKERFEKGYIAIACVDNGSHWIVTRAIRGKRVYIADPDSNQKYIALTTFLNRVILGSVVLVRNPNN